MGNVILVHGAWHGGWCWKKVTPLLIAHDYKVFTPTLTGLGNKKHLLSSKTNLTTHINDIVHFIRSEDLNDIVIVGHSYSGSVISGVAELEYQRIKKLVYLDAVSPLDGECTLDYFPSLSLLAIEMSVLDGVASVVPAPPLKLFGIDDPKDIGWAKNLLSPMPLNCFKEKINISVSDKISKTYILCTIPVSGESEAAFRKAYSRFKSTGASCYTIDAPHDVMITHPCDLKDVLIKCMETN